ncbi:MAG: methyltransferase domain-containing protein [Chitinophagaceae bacterium]|nr:methyltransferase domain-containing protein [Chitinophagaceae bacterium]
MRIEDAIALISKGVNTQGAPQTWADFGSGRGLFTYTLYSILPRGSALHAVDIEQSDYHYPTGVTFHLADFSRDQLTLPPLDGIVMANSLHYIQDQSACIRRIKNYLCDTGKIILIEYDTNRPNQWVPFPITFLRAQELFRASGFSYVTKIGERKSIFRGDKIYAALIS